MLTKINRLCRLFLWLGIEEIVAWKDCPKEEGGLDLRDSRCWNQALLSKILWNIHAKADTLWVKWLNSVYLRNQSVWE